MDVQAIMSVYNVNRYLLTAIVALDLIAHSVAVGKKRGNFCCLVGTYFAPFKTRRCLC